MTAYTYHFSLFALGIVMLDSDNDGLSDEYEINNSNTAPDNADTDHDGMDDGWEVTYSFCGMNALADDAADNADRDGSTNLEEYMSGTDPCQDTGTSKNTGSKGSGHSNGCTAVGSLRGYAWQYLVWLIIPLLVPRLFRSARRD